MIALALLCSTAAFLLLGIATDRHHRRHLGRWYSIPRARLLQVAGWSLLAATTTLTTTARGPAIGPIAGVGAALMGAALGYMVLNVFRSVR